MHLHPIHLVRCLEQVAVIEEIYKLNYWHAGDPYRSVDFLHNLSGSHRGAPVRLVKLPLDAATSALQGAFVKLDDGTADVVFAQGMDTDWERFVICKELFHGLLDNNGYRDMDIEGHVKAMVFSFPDDDSRPPVAVQVELLAEIAAMEFLYPYRYRLDGTAGGVNFAAIAKNFGVPLQLVERYCSETYLRGLNLEHIKSIDA